MSWSAVFGGQGGIRTRDTVPRIHTFQACAFNHSATCPCARLMKAHANFIKDAPAEPALCAFNHSATCPCMAPEGARIRARLWPPAPDLASRLFAGGWAGWRNCAGRRT